MSYGNFEIQSWAERIPDEPIELNSGMAIDLTFSFGKRRLGIPKGTIDHQVHWNDIKKILYSFMKVDNYMHKLPAINPELLQRVVHFRNNLMIYDRIVENKVFSCNEIYYNCLRRGKEYASFIKKARSKSLQAKESLEGVEEDQYVIEEYSGYDSIIHERYLIYWDESSDIDDYRYSLVEPNIDFREGYYRETIQWYLRKISWNKDLYTGELFFLANVANKKSYTNKDGKTTLLKNTWGPTSMGPWLATRRVVPTTPGSTRDTGVPDIQTLVNLKHIHEVSSLMSQRSRHSALCDLQTLTNRIERVRTEKNVFLHVDFKKFGLSTDRRVANIILEEAGLPELKIPDVYLRVDNMVYKTLRGGGSLGWCDPIFAIGVIAILARIKKQYGWVDMDFIVFNDDVEVSFFIRSEDEAILRKEIILTELQSLGFEISHRKVYLSEMSVFLEEYYSPVECDMEKRQLAVKPYADSMSTPYEWEAKYLYSEGWQRVRSVYIKELVMRDFIDELDPDRPVEIGGWTRLFDPTTGLNHALRHANREELEFFLRISRYREPHLMPKWEQYTERQLEKAKQQEIYKSVEQKVDKSELEWDPPETYTVEEIEVFKLRTRGFPEKPPRPTLPPRQRQEEFKGGT